MADNKVVIKIKRNPDGSRYQNSEPKMVTRWHVKRIVNVIIFAVLPFVALIYFLVKPDESLLLIKPGQMNQENPAAILESETIISSEHPQQFADSSKSQDQVIPKATPEEVTVPPMDLMQPANGSVERDEALGQGTQLGPDLAQSGQPVMNEIEKALPPEEPLVPVKQTSEAKQGEEQAPEAGILKEDSTAAVPQINLPTTGSQAMQPQESEFERSRKQIQAKSMSTKEALSTSGKKIDMPEPSINKAEMANQEIQQSALENELNVNIGDANKTQASEKVVKKDSAGEEAMVKAEDASDDEFESQESKTATPQKPAEAIIYDERISRTVLAKSIRSKEPRGEVGVPIVASPEHAVVVYFFTEITNMQGEVLFHHWLNNGESVFKRKIGIFGDRWRASTSKMISYSGKGHWVVQLINSQGKILSKIEFDVI